MIADFCKKCSGMGHVAASDRPLDMERVECPDCHGSGGGCDPWLLTHDEFSGRPYDRSRDVLDAMGWSEPRQRNA